MADIDREREKERERAYIYIEREEKYFSTYHIYVLKYTTNIVVYIQAYILSTPQRVTAYGAEVQQSCNKAATKLQQYQHIGCLHLSAYGAGERSPETLSY